VKTRRLEAVFVTPRLHRIHHGDAPVVSAVNLGSGLIEVIPAGPAM
jgi:sterol desaturase/sphingolipid hydroxylase (fatty acid hydroxylase superfamily)